MFRFLKVTSLETEYMTTQRAHCDALRERLLSDAHKDWKKRVEDLLQWREGESNVTLGHSPFGTKLVERKIKNLSPSTLQMMADRFADDCTGLYANLDYPDDRYLRERLVFGDDLGRACKSVRHLLGMKDMSDLAGRPEKKHAEALLRLAKALEKTYAKRGLVSIDSKVMIEGVADLSFQFPDRAEDIAYYVVERHGEGVPQHDIDIDHLRDWLNNSSVALADGVL